mgnify:CR=1 FL=1
MGVIKSSDLRDAEDFDVIGEVERKAETVKQNALEKENNKETEGEPNDKRSTEEVLANVGKNIGNALRGFAGGVKNFGIHCGYFCKNVSIMIKHKRAIAKRKKAEEERRREKKDKRQSVQECVPKEAKVTDLFRFTAEPTAAPSRIAALQTETREDNFFS